MNEAATQIQSCYSLWNFELGGAWRTGEQLRASGDSWDSRTLLLVLVPRHDLRLVRASRTALFGRGVRSSKVHLVSWWSVFHPSKPTMTLLSSNPRHAAAPSPQTAWDLLQQERNQESSLLRLIEGSNHDFLRLYPGGVYELAGPAGSGKTQIALHLCLRQAQANDTTNNTSIPHNSHPSCTASVRDTAPSYRAVYFSLGGSAKRNKILQRLCQMSSENPTLLNRIATRCVLNQDDWLQDVLNVQLPQLLEQQQQSSTSPDSNGTPRTSSRIRLVVVDALADLFRCVSSTTTSSVVDRAANLCHVAQRLHQLAHEHDLTVLVLNQVSGSHEQPALGLAWAHCCTTCFATTLSSTRAVVVPPVPCQSENHPNHEDGPGPQPSSSSKSAVSSSQPPPQRPRTLVLRHSSRYGGGGGLQVDFWIDRRGVHALPR